MNKDIVEFDWQCKNCGAKNTAAYDSWTALLENTANFDQNNNLNCHCWYCGEKADGNTTLTIFQYRK